MNISVILAHPRPGSFNHAIADEAAATAPGSRPYCYRPRSLPGTVRSVTSRTMRSPVMPSFPGPDRPALRRDRGSGRDRHCPSGLVGDAAGDPERLDRPGPPPWCGYRFADTDSGEGIPVGLLKARAAIIFNTSNTPRQRELEIFGDPLERIWKDCIVAFCGIPDCHRRMFGVIVTSSDEQRKAWLDEVRALTRNTFPDRQWVTEADRCAVLIPVSCTFAPCLPPLFTARPLVWYGDCDERHCTYPRN